MATSPQVGEFGTLLRHHRIAAGLTQRELAERAGVSARAISDLERGANRSAQRATLHQLAAALELPPGERDALDAVAVRRRGPRNAPTIDAGQLIGLSLPTGRRLGSLPEAELIGREEELARLLSTMDAVAAGQGRLVLLEGEPGIGKTRLAQEATCLLCDRSFLLGTGRCYEPEQATPYYPFLDALTAVYYAAPIPIRLEAGRRWPYLARLLPDLVTGQFDLLRQADEQQLLFWSVAGFVRAVAEAAPVALLLDDLHWADDSSLRLFMHLVRHTHSSRILLLGAYRRPGVGRQPQLLQMAADLEHEGLVERLRIGPLDRNATAQLVVQSIGTGYLSHALLDLIYARTEGNPFFVQGLLQVLRQRDELLRVEDYGLRRAAEELTLPESVRAVIQERVSRLAGTTQEVLREASVLGQTFTFEGLLDLAGREEESIDRALEEAVGTSLIQLTSTGDYAFDHALTQQVLYHNLMPRRRTKLHLARAEALERLPQEDRRRWPAEPAWHFRRAHEPRRALPYALLAGEAAESIFAHSEAEWHYRIALELAAELQDQRSQAEALEKLGVVLKLAGRYDEALELLDRAAHAYTALAHSEGRVRAVAQVGQTHFLRGTPAAGTAYIQPLLEGLEEAGPSEGLAALYSALAYLFNPLGDYANSVQAAERGSELARSIGNNVLLAHTEAMRGMSLSMLGRVEEGRRVLEEAIPLAEEVGDLESLRTALAGVGGYYTFAGRFGRARKHHKRLLEVVERMGDPAWIAFATSCPGWDTFQLGDWEHARTLLDRAASLDRSTPSSFSGYVLWQRGCALLGQGEWAEAARSLEEAVAVSEQTGNIQVVRFAQQLLAERDLLEGHAEAARARLEPLLDRPGLEEQAVTPFLPVLAWAHLETGDEVQAERILSNAVRRAAAQRQRPVLVDALRVRGMLATRRGRWEEAERSLSEAASLGERLPYPYGEARALYEMGQMYAQQAGVVAASGGSQQAGWEKLQEALEIFRRLGARRFVERTQQALSRVKATSTV